jgi:hypothetical protein
MSRRAFIVLIAASLLCCPAAAQTPSPRTVVILGVPAEVRDVEAQLTRPTIERVRGVPFIVIRSITDNADGSTIDAYRTILEATSRKWSPI